MKSRTNGTSVILTEVQKTLESMGEEAFLTMLKNARINISPDKNIQFVVAAVCRQLIVNIEDVTTRQSSDDTTKYCKAFIIYYLRTDFSVEWKVIKQLLDHSDQSWLWDLQNIIKKLKPKFKSDAVWLQHKEVLDSLIKEFKNNMI